MKYVLLIYLCVLSCEDADKQQVPASVLYLGIVVAGIYRICKLAQGRGSPGECLMAAVPGILFLAISALTRQIGEADGLILLIIGLASGLKITWEVLFMSLLLSAIHSVGMLIKKGIRSMSFPFIPFLALSFGIISTVTKAIVL